MSGRVLIADGDAERGRLIATACGERGIPCHVTTHGAAALEAALTDVPAALVVQFDLPLIDGPQLAAILKANPRTQAMGVVFVSDRKAEARRADAGGPVIPPPADPDAVAACVQTILGELGGAGRAPAVAGEPGGVEGQLSQLSLADLLQLFHVSRKSGVVAVVRRDARGRPETGRVFLRDGDVIQATVGTIEREKALYRLLAWDRGSFSFEPGPVSAAARIQMPTRALLRDGQRQLEEWRRTAVELPPADAEVTLRVERAALPNVIYPLTQEVLLVLELHSRVRDIVDHCSYPDYQVLRTLHTLAQRGIVELRRTAEFGAAAREPGLFTRARANRLREWIDGARLLGAAGGDAKLLVVASDAGVTRDFTRLLEHLRGVEIDDDVRAGRFSADDLLSLARLRVDEDLGVELVHVPAAERFAPLWPVAGHGALGTLVLISSPVSESAAQVRRAAETLRLQPRARVFHLLLIEKGERVAPDALQENLALIDDGSLFLIPLEDPSKAGVLLRELIGRVLP